MSATQTNKPQTSKEGAAGEAVSSGHLISVTVGGQLFGIPVLHAQDVLNPQRIMPIPLAPKAIAGSLNLRGRIVTAIDLRSCLGLPPCAEPSKSMSVVTEREGELYSLLVDSVGEVMTLSPSAFEQSPPTLRQLWREVCDGIYRLDGQLLLVLNVGRVLGGLRTAEAA